ncbi:MAG: AAA family ATPase [Candidatus Thorarchaeota archaeon]
MTKTTESLRESIWQVITTVESRGLFVHSEELPIKYKAQARSSSKISSVRLPLIAGACVLNSLVPRSAMLLVGGHGGGKTTLIKLLGRMLTGRSLDEIDEGMLRGHPQLTEEKMVATLRPGPLMKDGVEVVVWRQFVTNFWKIIDEANRLTPHAQNILLSMLAEGELKYYDEVMHCDDYCLYATMNPTDSGTFDLAPPFLDRFGMAVPITMPTIDDLELILSSRDDRLFGYDEMWQVPAITTEEDLLTIWNLADKVPVSQEASEFMRSLVREFGACIRVDKSQTHSLTVETGLCDSCHYNTAKSVCNKVIIPLSVRAVKDLNRYSKAAAWLIGAPEVGIELVKSLAPLIFWHRTRFVTEGIEKSPFFGNSFEYTKHLVELASSRFAQREPAIRLMDKLKQGEGDKTILEELSEMGKSDLLVRLDYIKFAKELQKSTYAAMVKNIEKAVKSSSVKDLTELQQQILETTDFPNRSMLLSRISEALHKLTLSQFSLTFEQWQDLWTTISLKIPKMTSILKETLKPPKRKVVRTDGVTLVVYVTGSTPESPVFLEISGGTQALDLRKEIEKHISSE